MRNNLDERIKDKLNERTSRRKWYQRITSIVLSLTMVLSFITPLDMWDFIKTGFALSSEGYDEEKAEEILEEMILEDEEFLSDYSHLAFYSTTVKMLDGEPNPDELTLEFLQNKYAVYVSGDDGEKHAVTDLSTLMGTPDDLKDKLKNITIISDGKTYTTNPIKLDAANNSDSKDLVLTMSYTYSSSQKASVNKDNPYIYYQVNTDDITIKDEYCGKNMMVWDYEYSREIPSGFYSVSKTGLIVIRFTDDYIDKKISNSEGFSGTLSFNGSIDRANNEDGDREVTIGNKTIEINFADRSISLDKTYETISNDDGTVDIEWTITIDNQYGFDLNGYELTDIMKRNGNDFANNATFSINPVGYMNESNGSYIFNYVYNETSKPHPNQVTITYVTKDAKGSYDNTAKVKTPSGKEYEDTCNATVDTKIQYSKYGAPDYNIEGMGQHNKIQWKITVEDVSAENLKNLAGSKIIDKMFVGLKPEDILIVNSKDNSQVVESDKYVLSGDTLTLNASAIGLPNSIDIIFTTSIDPGDDVEDVSNNKKATNTVEVIPPEGKDPDPRQPTAEVPYNPGNFDISKDGSINYDAGEITWTITANVSKNDNILKGYKLIDEQFDNHQITVVEASDNYQNLNAEQLAKISVVNGEIKSTDSSLTADKIVVRYSVPIKDALGGENSQKYKDYLAGGEVTAENDVTLNNGDYKKTETGTQSVKMRKSADKWIVGGSDTVYGNSQFTDTTGLKELTWTVDMINDNGFETFEDNLSLFENESDISSKNLHYILADKFNLKVEYKDSADQSYTQAAASAYTVTGNTDNSTAFEITFTDANLKKHKYIRVTYTTVADVGSDLANGKGVPEGSSYIYKNEGGFDDTKDDATYTFERKDVTHPDLTNVRINKQWNDNNSEDKRPSEIYVKIERKLGDGDWEQVKNVPSLDANGKADFSNMVSVGENGIITITKDEQWNKIINNLPQWNPSAPLVNGRPQRYDYRLVEMINRDGTFIEGAPINYKFEKTMYTESGVSFNEADTTMTLINTTTLTNLTITKAWEDKDNKFGDRPYAIYVELYRIDSNGVEEIVPIEANDVAGDFELDGVTRRLIRIREVNGNWTSININNLPQLDGNGSNYSYGVREVAYQMSVTDVVKAVDNSFAYTPKYNFGNGETVVANGLETSINITNISDQMTLKLQKEWNDQDNNYNERPDSVCLTIEYSTTPDDESSWADYREYIGMDSYFSIDNNNRISKNEWEKLFSKGLDKFDKNTHNKMYYRIVEYIDSTEVGEKYNSVLAGKYVPSYTYNGVEASYFTPSDDTSEFTARVKNTSKSDFAKFAVKNEGYKATGDYGDKINTVSIESLEKNKAMVHLIKRGEDGSLKKDETATECYIFQWEVVFNGGKSAPLHMMDELPDDCYLINEPAIAGQSFETSDGSYYIQVSNTNLNSNFELSFVQNPASWQVDAGNYYNFSSGEGKIDFYLDKSVVDLKYFTAIPVEVFNSKYDEEHLPTYTNKITYFGEETVKKEASITVVEGGSPTPKVDKMDKTVNSTPNQLAYTIDFNKDASWLAGGYDITLTDIMNLSRSPESSKDITQAFIDQIKLNFTDFSVIDESSKEDITSSIRYHLDYDSAAIYQNCAIGKAQELSTGVYWEIMGFEEGKQLKFVLKGNPGEKVNTTYSDNNIRLVGYNAKFDDANLNSNQLFNQEIKTSAVYDSNGEYIILYTIPAKTKHIILSVSDNALNFTGMSAGLAEPSDAALTMTVPDGKHLKIKYYYDITSGFTTGDFIQADNTVSFDTGYARESDTATKSQVEITSTGATSTTKFKPTIYKVDVGNHAINDLVADFVVARYDKGAWYYLSNYEVTQDDDDARLYNKFTFGTTNEYKETDGMIPAAALEHAFKITRTSNKLLDFEEGVLYKFIEINGTDNPSYIQPEWYDADGNLKPLADNPDFIYYFAYGEPEIPSDVSKTRVEYVAENGDVKIPNSKKINITANKTFAGKDEIPEGTEVTFELWWSREESSTRIPDDAQIVKTRDIKGLPNDFSARKDLAYESGETNTVTWSGLPSGNYKTPIYYYVVETAYRIDGVQYVRTVMDDGTVKYMNGTNEGVYQPSYTGNGTDGSGGTDTANGTDVTVSVTNSEGMVAKKFWRNADGSLMSEADIPYKNVTVKIICFNDEENTSTVMKKENDDEVLLTLSFASNWSALVPQDILQNYIDEGYNRFQLVENSIDLILISNESGLQLWKNDYHFETPSTPPLNGTNGVLAVTNTKDKTLTKLKVTKGWSDGAENHSEDIEIHLYRSETKYSAGDLNAILSASLVPSDMELVKAEDLGNPDGFVNPITLNTSVNWSGSWNNLPTEGSDNKHFYYYALELSPSENYIANYALSDHISSQDVTITNIRNTGYIRIDKMWTDGEADEKEELTFDVYSSLTPIDGLDKGNYTPPVEGYDRLISKSEYSIIDISKKLDTDQNVNKVTLHFGDPLADWHISSVKANVKVKGIKNDGTTVYSKIDVDASGITYSDENKSITFTVPDKIGNLTIDNYYFSNENPVDIETINTVKLTANSSAPNIYISGVDVYNNDTLLKTWSNDILSIPRTTYKPVDLTLTGASKVESKTITVTKQEDGTWKGQPVELPVADSNGNKFYYYVKERSSDLYYPVAYVNNGLQLVQGIEKTITVYNQTPAKDTFGLTVNKAWDGVDNAEDYKKDVTFKLYQKLGNTEKPYPDNDTTYTIPANDGKLVVTGLKFADENGTAYEYRVEETGNLSAYNVSYIGNNQSYDESTADSAEITITNTIKTGKIKVKKVWVMNGATLNAESITVNLTAGDDYSQQLTLEKDKASLNNDTWEWVIKDLPLYAADGTELKYTVTEDSTSSSGYKVTYGDNNNVSPSTNDYNISTATITNTYTQFTMKIQKDWAGEEAKHTNDEITVIIHRSTTDKGNNNLNLIKALEFMLGKSSIKVDEETTLSAQFTGVAPEERIPANVTYDVFTDEACKNPGDDSIVTINENTVKGVGEGTVYIRATADGYESNVVELKVKVDSSLNESCDFAIPNSSWDKVEIPSVYHDKVVANISAYFKDNLSSFPQDNFFIDGISDKDWQFSGNVATKVYNKDGLQQTGTKLVGCMTSRPTEIEKLVITYEDGSTFTVNNTNYDEDGNNSIGTLSQSMTYNIGYDQWQSVQIPSDYKDKELSDISLYFKNDLNGQFPNYESHTNPYLKNAASNQDLTANRYETSGNIAIKGYDGQKGADTLGWWTKYDSELEKIVVNYKDGSTFTVENNSYVRNAAPPRMIAPTRTLSDSNTTTSSIARRITRIGRMTQAEEIIDENITVNTISEAIMTMVAPRVILLAKSGGGWENDNLSVTINAADDNWIKEIPLPMYDDNGNKYYYWVEENFVKTGDGANVSVDSRYNVSYRFSDDNEETFYCIDSENSGDASVTIQNIANPDVPVELPESGGTGTKPYTAAGIAIMLLSGTTTLYFKRRSRRERKNA